MCHTPMLLGALMPPESPFQRVDNQKKTREKMPYVWPISYIGRRTCPMVATSGFGRSPELPPSGDALGCRLSGEWLRHHGRRVFWSFCVLWLFLHRLQLATCKKMVQNSLKDKVNSITFWPTYACTTPHAIIAPLFLPPISTTLCAHAHYEKWLAWPCLWIRPPWLF